MKRQTTSLQGVKPPGPRQPKLAVGVRKGTSQAGPSSMAASRKASGTVGLAAAYSTAQHLGPAKINKTAGGTRITHREFLGQITGTVAFTVSKFIVNPGQTLTFPWLAPQAVQWESYRFHRLAFEYITRCGSTESGSVLMSPDYDAADATPTTELQLTTYDGATEDSPWRNQRNNLKPSAMFSMGSRKFVRGNGLLPASADIKTYDCANMFIATIGTAANAWGKLWVDYDVEFFTPQTAIAIAGPASISFYTNNAAQTFATTVASALLLQTIVFDPLGVGTFTVGVSTPPAGSYYVSLVVSFVDTVLETFSGTAQIVLNGAPTVPPSLSAFRVAGVAGAEPNISMQTVIVCTGATTVAVSITLTGAAGVLTVPINGANITFTPV